MDKIKEIEEIRDGFFEFVDDMKKTLEESTKIDETLKNMDDTIGKLNENIPEDVEMKKNMEEKKKALADKRTEMMDKYKFMKGDFEISDEDKQTKTIKEIQEGTLEGKRAEVLKALHIKKKELEQALKDKRKECRKKERKLEDLIDEITEFDYSNKDKNILDLYKQRDELTEEIKKGNNELDGISKDIETCDNIIDEIIYFNANKELEKNPEKSTEKPSKEEIEEFNGRTITIEEMKHTIEMLEEFIGRPVTIEEMINAIKHIRGQELASPQLKKQQAVNNPPVKNPQPKKQQAVNNPPVKNPQPKEQQAVNNPPANKPLTREEAINYIGGQELASPQPKKQQAVNNPPVKNPQPKEQQAVNNPPVSNEQPENQLLTSEEALDIIGRPVTIEEMKNAIKHIGGQELANPQPKEQQAVNNPPIKNPQPANKPLTSEEALDFIGKPVTIEEMKKAIEYIREKERTNPQPEKSTEELSKEEEDFVKASLEEDKATKVKAVVYDGENKTYNFNYADRVDTQEKMRFTEIFKEGRRLYRELRSRGNSALESFRKVIKLDTNITGYLNQNDKKQYKEYVESTLQGRQSNKLMIIYDIKEGQKAFPISRVLDRQKKNAEQIRNENQEKREKRQINRETPTNGNLREQLKRQSEMSERFSGENETILKEQISKNVKKAMAEKASKDGWDDFTK